MGGFQEERLIDPAEKREMKYNLLPDIFQERFDELEVDWTEMTHSKFLSEAHKCEEADRKVRFKKDQDKEKTTNKRRREDTLSNIPCKDRENNERNKNSRDNGHSSNAG